MPEMGQCRLCQNPGQLQLSHIIPKFAVRWLRESVGGAALRSSAVPNLRIQDGQKEHLLCQACEQLLSQWEAEFTERVFLPYHNNKNQPPSLVRYEKWALKFAVSLSWRVLEYRHPKIVDQFGPCEQQAIEAAREVWRKFLLSEVTHPGIFEQHLLPLDVIADFRVPKFPPFFNRYLVTTCDMDFVRSGNTTFIYSKLCKLCFFGFIRYLDHDRKIWKGTKLHVNNGHLFAIKDTVIPNNILEFLFDRSNIALNALNRMSPKQAEKVTNWTLQNRDTFIETDTFLAMLQDVRFSGARAALRPTEKLDTKRTNQGE
jgi:hypothetical protein